MTASVEPSAKFLTIGDPAPPLATGLEFLQGEPLAALEPGRIYAVEFWATWCGPCRSSIPHLRELAARYPEVEFISVAVSETDWSAPAAFIATPEGNMPRRVALDERLPGGDGREGVMRKTWKHAAGHRGIPCTFVVDGTGTIAAITHPLGLDEPLARIVAGELDLIAARAKHDAERADVNTRRAALQAIHEAGMRGEYALQIQLIDEAAKPFPQIAAQYQNVRVAALARCDRNEEAITDATAILDRSPDDDRQLALLAAAILGGPGGESPKLSPEVAALTFRIARRADEVSGGTQYEAAAILAWAAYANGDPAFAKEAGERALRLVADNPAAAQYDPGLLARLRREMPVYEAALVAQDATHC